MASPLERSEETNKGHVWYNAEMETFYRKEKALTAEVREMIQEARELNGKLQSFDIAESKISDFLSEIGNAALSRVKGVFKGAIYGDQADISMNSNKETTDKKTK